MRLAVLPLASAFLFLSAQFAGAVVVQTVRTTADPIPGSIDVDLDSESAATPDGIDEDIFAQSVGPNGSYTVSASAGRFGQVGLFGRTIIPGRFSSEVEILDNDIFNPTTSPRSAMANFIVDGGDMVLVAGTGSSLSFNLFIEAAVGGSVQTVFNSLVRLEVDASGATQLFTSGDSLGAQKTSNPFAVEIPLSFQSVDLGIVGPNETLGLRYTASFDAFVTGFAEVVEFGFSDPLTVGLEPASIRFEPAMLDGVPRVTPVPVPAGGPLLLAGLAALTFVARRRRG